MGVRWEMRGGEGDERGIKREWQKEVCERVEGMRKCRMGMMEAYRLTGMVR